MQEYAHVGGRVVAPRVLGEREQVGRLLYECGYSLQANRKTIEGKQHPDRDAQFRHISQRVLAWLEPVVVATAKRAREASLDDLGSATFRADLAGLRHETQYTRLFRS